MKRLSIIIPMYNVASYVERCIRSLENQDIPKEDYELICINDGSPDNCKDIVEELQNEFSNIILINQENQGVSRARNNGVDKASGKYLLFIDPDDYVDHNSFSRILKTTNENNAQVSFLGFSFLNEDGSLRNTYFQSGYSGKVFSGIEAYLNARGDGRTDPDRMWAVLYEREFIIKNDLRFLPDVPYLEDGELIARILCLAERCIFEGHSFYQRTTRPGSATRSNLIFSDKAINGFILAAQNLKEFQDSDNLNTEQKEFLNQSICKFTLTGLIPIASFKYFSKFRANVKLLRKANLKHCPLKKCNNYYYIEGSLYNISPYLFFIHRLLNAPLLKLVRP